MTYPDELTQIERVKDTTLFIIYDGSLTRAVSGAHLKEFLLANGFNPASFVRGFIDNEILYMENQEGKEVEIGEIVQFLHNHDIQELRNVPPLEANKLFKVNSTGTGVIYTDKFTLDNNDIQDLRNVPALEADKFLKVTPDGARIEFVAATGANLGIQNNSTPIGDATALNLGVGLDVSITNKTANITALQHEKALKIEILTTTRTIVAADAGTQFLSDTAFNLDDLCILPDLATVKDGFFVDILQLGSFAKVVNVKEPSGAVLIQMQYLDSIRVARVNGAYMYLPINDERKAQNLTDKQYADLNYHQWEELPDSSYVMNFTGAEYKNLPSGLTLSSASNYRIQVDLVNYGAYTRHPFSLFAQRITISSGINTPENGYIAIRTGDTFANAQAFGWKVYVKKHDLEPYALKTALDDYVKINSTVTQLKEFPALVADKFVKVNPAGTDFIYADAGGGTVDLTTHDIEELRNVPALIADQYLKVNKAGDAIEYVAGGGGTVDLSTHNIQELKNVPALIADQYLKVNAAGDAIEFDSVGGNFVTIDTPQEILAEKTYLQNQYYRYVNIYDLDKTTGLMVESFVNETVFKARKAGVEKIAIKIPDDGSSVGLCANALQTVKTRKNGIAVCNDFITNTDRVGYLSCNNSVINIGTCDSDANSAEASGVRITDGGAVELFNADTLALKTQDDGILLNNNRTANGRMGRISTADGDVSIGSVKSDGTDVVDGIKVNDKGVVELYFNGLATAHTTHDGFTLLKNPNGFSQLWISAAVAGTFHRLGGDPNGTMFLAPATTGQLFNQWTGSVTPSSLDLKTNIQPLNGLSKIQLLQPLQWDWSRPEYSNENHETIGFSAESYEKVFPELVAEYNPIEDKPNPDSEDTEHVITQEEQEKIDYFKGVKGIKKAITSMKMDAIVVDAIQQLANDNHGLRLRIEALESALREFT